MAGKPVRILLVDDDEALLRSLAERCRLRGFEPETATTGAEAIEKAEKSEFRVAVVDLRLPDLGGLEVITKLRAIRPETATILLTAFGDDRLREATEALNAAYFDKDDMGSFWEFLEGVPFRTVNILVVDDDEKLLEAMAKRIRAKGHDPLTATTGAAALEMARRFPIQVAVVDLRLPDMEGLVVITKLKEVQPRVETVLLTAFGDEKLREATEALNSAYFDKEDMPGFWGFLRKVLRKLETTMAAAGLATHGDVDDARAMGEKEPGDGDPA